MIRDIQLYIENPATSSFERLELFGEEGLSITDSIKNAKDISKVFTTFSNQYTIPASKNNNKIFKHYYNYNITNGFDARKKINARIEINTVTFKKGKLKLDGVELRNNSPYAYKVTFYGSVVDLKDILGEDKLPSLTALDIDKEYSAAAVKSALTSGVAADGTIIPLITHTQRLYYDSARDSEQSGNLYNSAINQGVKFDQLKYAIRLDKILNAIDSQYPQINFAQGSFFDPAENTDITKLFMWCHRKKGGLDLGSNAIYSIVDGFNPSENVDSVVLKVKSPDDHIVFVEEAVEQMNQLFFATTTSNTTSIYDIIIYKNSGSGFEIFQEQLEVFGGIEVQIIDTFVDGVEYYAAIRTYEEPITFSGFEWSATYSGGEDSFLEGTKTFAQSFSFNIAENLPEMKIIDFLSALFKMFNLVAYIDENDEVYVEPLDDFYETGELDITKYIDVQKSQVNAALPYREIFFKYKDTGTILAEQHLQEISQIEWGGVEYTDIANLSGGIYKLEPDFHHAKYEKLLDNANALIDTGIQVGYFVDDNEESYLGDPLILYIDGKQANFNIGFLERNSKTVITTSQSINMPSNTFDIDDQTSENIHFNAELSEYTGVAATETLFKRFYQPYIENVFNVGTRLTKLSSYLPAGEILRLRLSKVLVISGNKYRINSFQTNLKTGKTDFELINYYD
jgi:hypothetical protein